jgi:hypothetical protein
MSDQLRLGGKVHTEQARNETRDNSQATDPDGGLCVDFLGTTLRMIGCPVDVQMACEKQGNGNCARHHQWQRDDPNQLFYSKQNAPTFGNLATICR